MERSTLFGEPDELYLSRVRDAEYARETQGGRRFLALIRPLVLLPHSTPFLTSVGVGKMRSCVTCRREWWPLFELRYSDEPKELSVAAVDTSAFQLEVEHVVLQLGRSEGSGVIRQVEVHPDLLQLSAPLSASPDRVLLEGRFICRAFRGNPVGPNDHRGNPLLAVWKFQGSEGAYGIAVYGRAEQPNFLKLKSLSRRQCSLCFQNEMRRSPVRIGPLFVQVNAPSPRISHDSFGMRPVPLSPDRPVDPFGVGVDIRGEHALLFYYAYPGVFREPTSAASIFIFKGRKKAGYAQIHYRNAAVLLENTTGEDWGIANIWLDRSEI